MTRLLGLILCVTIVALGAFALGRGVDVEAQDRVIFTQRGVTLDCAREWHSGQAFYVDCHNVP